MKLFATVLMLGQLAEEFREIGGGPDADSS